MRRKLIEFSKDTAISIPIALLVAVIGSVWFAGVRFSKLTEKIEENWTFGMEREAWLEVKIKNPDFNPPDAMQIRKDHQAIIFRDRSSIAKTNEKAGEKNTTN